MKRNRKGSFWLWICAGAAGCFLLPGSQAADGADTSSARSRQVVVVELEGQVEFAPKDCPDCWHACRTNEVIYPGYRLRTGPSSRAMVRLPDLTQVPMGPGCLLDVYPEDEDEESNFLFRLLEGALYFFRRGEPGEYRIGSPTVSTVTRGTEFSLEVAANGTTTLWLFEGHVTMRNAEGELDLRAGEAATVEPGDHPRLVPFVDTAHALQWRLYYPGVLDVAELPLTLGTREDLRDSLAAYDKGDLQRASRLYPNDRVAEDAAERIYRAALHLVVGEVDRAESDLKRVESDVAASGSRESGLRPFVSALRTLMNVVRSPQGSGKDLENRDAPSRWATVWMAESYRQQAFQELSAAREAARRATELSPRFSFAWVRLAELEFSFGRNAHALQAVERGLELGPRNAQALALHGFILASRGQIAAAIERFDEAIAVNGALGNAWLGRGLCSIRRGRTEEGLLDLQAAVALEPQRSLLRSYLGKAFQITARDGKAEIEWQRAVELDALDPTPWLYRALGSQQQLEINRALRELERSQDLNQNRLLYRSQLLIDQDRAVRGANLARVYQDAGMDEVSRREAIRALHSDYANYSAHWFLANSYNELRDPRQVDLRYETAWLSEYLVANLMSPPTAGTLSPLVSQQEYGHLFEQDRLGLSTWTEYRSNGDWLQTGSQFGNYGGSAYALDATYRSQNGYRRNEDLEDLSLTLRLKQQLGPRDQIYVQGIYYDAEFGDLTRYYDPDDAIAGLRVEETQEPIVLAGYHHAWGEGSHTLILGGRLNDTLSVDNPRAGILALQYASADPRQLIRIGSPDDLKAELDYESEYDANTLEAQQIWQQPHHALVVGGRFQNGTLNTRSDLTSTNILVLQGLQGLGSAGLPALPSPQSASGDLQRMSGYAYYEWQPWDALELVAGVAYDRLDYPDNFRIAPISEGQESRSQWSPKAGVIWEPHPEMVWRAAYTRSLGGVGIDQSFRLEPTQVGGFNQAYRSLVPESVAGNLSGSRFETWGAAWDQKFGSNTWFSIEGQLLRSETSQAIGVVGYRGGVVYPDEKVEHIDFEERALLVTLNRLVGNHVALGASYRWSDADLAQEFPGIELAPGRTLHGDVRSTLHQVKIYGLAYFQSGWFGQADAIWSQQSNHGYDPDRPGDDVWQVNVHAGYRWWRRRAEARLSLLNVLDQDYRLNPLNPVADMPRERTLAMSLRLAF